MKLLCIARTSANLHLGHVLEATHEVPLPPWLDQDPIFHHE
jgi:hypothetical protein